MRNERVTEPIPAGKARAAPGLCRAGSWAGPGQLEAVPLSEPQGSTLAVLEHCCQVCEEMPSSEEVVC